MLTDWTIPAALPAPRAEPGGAGDSIWRAGRFSPAEIEAVVARLAERGAVALATLPIPRRIEVWSESIAAFLDPESDERRALLPSFVATSRLSPEGLTEALEVILGGASGEVAERLATELSPAPPRGPAGVSLAANVPALAVQMVLPALLLGRPLLLRSSAREPLFAPALVAALARREPALGEAFAALSWPSDSAESFRAAFGSLDRVIAYGGAAALASLRAALDRGDGALEALVALGPRASVALVAGEIDAISAGRKLARDVALLDQRGCLSVQSVWLAGSPSDARELAEALAWGLAIESRRLPPGPAEPEIAAAVQQLRGEAALRDALVGRLETREGSVILAESDRFSPVPGMRTIRVHVEATLDRVLDCLASARGSLQGAALAGEETEARRGEIVERLGLARVAPVGRLQHAEAGWRSGGIDPLQALA